jgi:hypothetical protein
MRCPDEVREPVPAGGDGEWPLPHARGRAGVPKGNRNAFRHGPYTAEANAGRREVAALIRAMRTLACATEEVS